MTDLLEMSLLAIPPLGGPRSHWASWFGGFPRSRNTRGQGTDGDPSPLPVSQLYFRLCCPLCLRRQGDQGPVGLPGPRGPPGIGIIGSKVMARQFKST